ncbi:nucleotide sugar dehydrogenase [Virgibacillus necropolis]|uniref:UDP-N-acetyl-D-galactosamine dehydrogenase n=1 Tax=Virgibacillus necropolis TaxID=163877 RepID=A0A221M9A7_9BACI|nr:nucleotide sugar dehydrogenase [Virgibacillus necropolis]ASN04227.1 UDP-N-acetyl-D-galactosamine dehydrogenase [Virgibacillus necropolis]
MSMFSKIKDKEEKVSVIGLGYVGFPLAIELAKKYDVVGFDTNIEKIEAYKKGIDVTQEVGDEAAKESTILLTNNQKELKNCRFHIVSVPTPINSDKTPNLTPIIEASKTVAKNLSKGSIVVYESTVYPGTTEEICIPILEEYSGLQFSEDFKVGYSPERINPGDKVNTLTKIKKIVSGSDEESLKVIFEVYDSIIEAGIHKAPTIKVAEAAKVIENSQRDINIAFMNELSMVFNKMNINTNDVLEAAGTKWNFLKFQPGLVGGHCIGVDPYYFTYKAEQLGYHSQIILSGRKINDEMGKYIATNVIKQIIQSGQPVKGSKVAIFGITFKENVSDVRNTKVIDIVEELKDYGVNVLVHDPIANNIEVKAQYKIDLVDKEDVTKVNAVVLAVPHKEFYSYYTSDYFDGLYAENRVLVDVKGVLNKLQFESRGYSYWSL